MKRRSLAIFFLSLVTVLFSSVTGAQERFGTLTGQVTDQSSASVPGVTVTVTNTQTGEVRVFVTDSDGRYSAADLAPGRYNVRFELAGFSKVERADVNVLLGRAFQLDSQMRVGDLSETVQVTGEAAPLVDVRSTVVQHNVTAEEFDQLPKSRTFQSIALTAPSVNEGQIEGGIQVNGASGSENQFTVDGVSTNSLVNGQSRQNAVFEHLQEIQVKTVGIPAEFGGALGGVVSAVTKSGGNVFRGEAHYYYEGSAIGAAPVKRLVLNPSDDVTVGYFQDSKPSDNRNEIGGSLGGPIVKDHLFFFGSLSPRYNSRTSDYNFSSGAEQGEITRDQTIMSAFGKITYANNRLRADFSALYTPTTSDGTLPAYNAALENGLTSSATANEPSKVRGYEIHQRNFSGSTDINVSNSSFLSLKVGRFYDDYKDVGIPLTTNYTYQTSSVNYQAIPASLRGPINTLNTPRAIINENDTTTQTFFNADYNHVLNAGGLHTFKGGFGVRRNVNNVLQAYPGGYVDIYWDATFTSLVPGVAPGRGAYGYYAVNDRGTRGEAKANIMSLYVQDQWSIGNRFTLNLGLRTENESIPSFKTDIKEEAIKFNFGDKLAPRIGAAYDLKGDGRQKIYGSWGRYYDWTKYEVSRGAFGGDTWNIFYHALDTLDIGSLNLSNLPGRDLWGSNTNPALSYRDRRVPNFDTVDPLIKPMSQDSFNIGYEQQIGRGMTWSAAYVHNNLVRTIEDLGTLVDGSEVYYYANPGEGNALITPVSTATAPFATPKPKRVYDALELTVNKRFSSNWFGGASYVLSRLYGNYSGIQSSDEIRTPTTNVGSATAQQQAAGIFRAGGNANRAWDTDELLWDSHGNLNPEGRLATDRPHVVKLYGSYMAPFGTQFGGFFYGGSGTPLTTYVVTGNQTEVFVNGRGDMGRTPVLTRTDLLVAQELPMGNRRLRLELNVLNLFNQQTARHVFNYLNRGAGAARSTSAITLTNVDLAKGYDYEALIRATPDGAVNNAKDPRYGQEDLFSDGIQGQFLVKFTF